MSPDLMQNKTMFVSVVIVAVGKDEHNNPLYYGSHNTKRKCIELPAERATIYETELMETVDRLLCKELNICDAYGLTFQLYTLRSKDKVLFLLETKLEWIEMLSRKDRLIYDKHIDRWMKIDFSGLNKWSQDHIRLIEDVKCGKVKPWDEDNPQYRLAYRESVDKWGSISAPIFIDKTGLSVKSGIEKQKLDLMSLRQSPIDFSC